MELDNIEKKIDTMPAEIPTAMPTAPAAAPQLSLAQIVEMIKTPKYEGTPVTIGTFTLVVPALTLKQLRGYIDEKALPNVSDLMEMGADALTDKVMPVVLAALRRNYPPITQEMIEEHTDLAQWQRLQTAVMGKSGIRVNKPGEAAPVAK